MNKSIKIIIIGIILLAVCYAGYFIYKAAKYSHTLDRGNISQNYIFLFKDSIRGYIDKSSQFSYAQKNDVYNHYIFKDKYYITVWEFKWLKSIDIKNISINTSTNLKEAEFRSGETLNSGYSPEITIKYGFNFNSGMNISIDKESKVEGTFHSAYYKGFYGSVNKMLLRNVQWNPQILFDYTRDRQHGLFIFYMHNKKFYILIINSDKQFNPKRLIKIFDLL